MHYLEQKRHDQVLGGWFPNYLWRLPCCRGRLLCTLFKTLVSCDRWNVRTQVAQIKTKPKVSIL